MTHTLRTIALAVRCSVVMAGCSNGSSNTPFKEILDQGIDRYLGLYTPMLSEVDGDTTNHRFGEGDGPLCLRGTEYTVATRPAASENLMIFLEGGGACWSELCLANEEALPGVAEGGVLDPTLAVNPMADWNVTYLPYCDGSLFSGDIDHDYENDGVTEFQRGLRNLSAGLDVAKREFPNPRRIVLTGNSGGGFGTIFALPLVRSLFPDTQIDVINDSGVGVAENAEAQALLNSDWNNEAFLPQSICPDCYADGTLAEYFNWQMAEDPNFNLAMMSTKRDAVIADLFLGIGGEAFEARLIPYLTRLETDNPARFRSFIADGNAHTFIRREITTTAGGVAAHDWIQSMLDDNNWTSVSD